MRKKEASSYIQMVFIVSCLLFEQLQRKER